MMKTLIKSICVLKNSIFSFLLSFFFKFFIFIFFFVKAIDCFITFSMTIVANDIFVKTMFFIVKMFFVALFTFDFFRNVAIIIFIFFCFIAISIFVFVTIFISITINVVIFDEIYTRSFHANFLLFNIFE